MTQAPSPLESSDLGRQSSLQRALAALDLTAMRASLATEEGRAALRAPAPMIPVPGEKPIEPGPLLIQAIDLNFERGALLLVENGAELEARGRKGATPLIAATDQFLPSLIAALLARGADLAALDRSGQSPLHKAAGDHSPDALLALSPAKPWPNVNSLDNNGLSPLALASRLRIESNVEILLAGGADPQLATPYGMSPLMLAAQGGPGAAAVIALLLSRGADPTEEISGHTALNIALDRDQLDTFEALLAGGADLFAKSRVGRSAAAHARRLLAAQPGNETARFAAAMERQILEREALANSLPRAIDRPKAKTL